MVICRRYVNTDRRSFTITPPTLLSEHLVLDVARWKDTIAFDQSCLTTAENLELVPILYHHISKLNDVDWTNLSKYYFCCFILHKKINTIIRKKVFIFYIFLKFYCLYYLLVLIVCKELQMIILFFTDFFQDSFL